MKKIYLLLVFFAFAVFMTSCTEIFIGETSAKEKELKNFFNSDLVDINYKIRIPINQL